MRKYITFILVLLVAIQAFPQNFSKFNSTERKAIVIYTRNYKGFYQKSENKSVSEVEKVTSIYAFDKRKHNLYVKTDNANYVITLDEFFSKMYKKDKFVPQKDGQDLALAISMVNDELATKFAKLNDKWQKHLDDSIQIAKEAAIRKAREDSILRAKELARAEKYRKTKKWKIVPIPSFLKCDLCDSKSPKQDSVFVLKIANDTILWLTNKNGYLDQSYSVYHITKLTKEIKSFEPFKYHYTIFKDSLCAHFKNIDEKMVEVLNQRQIDKYAQNLKNIAPYGFFKSWSWGSEDSFISFNFEYLNTNVKTIKYIDVSWTVTNDVGDVRKTGHFQGTGPLEEWEFASWNWDTSGYYLAGDATNMEISQVTITYMDGSTKVLGKSMLRFN